MTDDPSGRILLTDVSDSLASIGRLDEAIRQLEQAPSSVAGVLGRHDLRGVGPDTEVLEVGAPGAGIFVSVDNGRSPVSS